MVKPRVVLDVDTGIDDAAALLWAATAEEVEIVAATATWGNCDVDQAARNTRTVLDAAGCDVPVHVGADVAEGPAPEGAPAAMLMGADGLGDAGVVASKRPLESEDAAAAIVRLARAAPGSLTLVCVAPLSTLASALAAEPDLPSLLAGITVMGGAISDGGNLTAAADANFGHDPVAAAAVIDAFGRPNALASGQAPRLVPLDVTVAATFGPEEMAALADSALAGTDLLHTVLAAIWDLGVLETGGAGLALHDLLAIWSLTNPRAFGWESLPLTIDTAGGAAWGATVADRRVRLMDAADLDPELRRTLEQAIGVVPTRWDVAMSVDADAFRSGLHAWLTGTPSR